MWKDKGQEREVPEEILSSDNLVEGDEHQGLREHGKIDVVNPVESEGNDEEEDD